MTDPDDLMRVKTSGLFDESWYLRQYPDVAMLGMDAAQHFLRYGGLLRRDPGPEFDTSFYLDTYGDTGGAATGHDGRTALNPLLHYLQLGAAPRRPVSARQLRDSLAELERRTRAEWERTPIAGRRVTRPVISYCIPLMGRLGDLKGTLQTNLEAHAALREKVEFLIVLFGDSHEAMTWIHQEFGEQLADGFLRVVTDDSLDTWHFGKAKNAFRPHLLGEIYSSLDGDNFVTREETRRLLDVHEQYGGLFLLHHFSGQWGDGTSGRVSLPTAIYREIGYAPRMMPRQYDEIDLMLRALAAHPAMPLLCIDRESNFLMKSGHAKRFFEQEKLPNRIVEVPSSERRPPLNPRGADYTKAAAHLRIMGDWNAYYSGYIASGDPARRQRYLNLLTAERDKLVDIMSGDDLIDTLFQTGNRPVVSPIAAGEVGLFMCVRDEAHFLPPLIRHYRRRGVKAFFIVDDGSKTPVEQLLHDPDVHVFHPKVGDFRTSKTLWIEALMKRHLPEGGWALTVDADEFIHLPVGFASFPALGRHLARCGADFAVGLMLDLLPAPGMSMQRLQHAERDFEDLFTHCCDIESVPSADYAKDPCIAWGFGPFAGMSWRVDARYHAFGTFDSLRKIPFLRRQPRRHLNQGFHTLHYTDGRPQPRHDEVWLSRPILPVFHYKLVRLFSDEARAQMLRQAASYHARTGDNLARIFSGDGSDAVKALLQLAPKTVPAARFCAAFEEGGFQKVA